MTVSPHEVERNVGDPRVDALDRVGQFRGDESREGRERKRLVAERLLRDPSPMPVQRTLGRDERDAQRGPANAPGVRPLHGAPRVNGSLDEGNPAQLDNYGCGGRRSSRIGLRATWTPTLTLIAARAQSVHRSFGALASGLDRLATPSHDDRNQYSEPGGAYPSGRPGTSLITWCRSRAVASPRPRIWSGKRPARCRRRTGRSGRAVREPRLDRAE